MADESVSGYAEIRRVMLAFHEPRSVSEIFAVCDSVARQSDVACFMHAERAAGRVERFGDKGNFTYLLTESGRAAAENPRLLRGRSNRRVRGRGLPPPPVASAPEPTTAIHPLGMNAEGTLAQLREKLDAIPSAAARSQASAEQDATERGARLAAAVLTHWPTHIRAMPDELRQAVQASIAPAISRA